MTLWQGFLFGVVASGLVALAVWAIPRLPGPEAGRTLGEAVRSPIGIAALLIMLILMALVIWLPRLLLDRILGRIEREIEAYRKGQEGEERAVEAVRQALDGNWTLFRNVRLPGRSKADIDLVLVGPPGVWAIEVKTLAGEYRNIGEHWERRAGNRWELLKQSPSRQAQDNAVRLANFLRADGIRQWVNPAVVWADHEGVVTVENPMVPVWPLERLPEELGNIWQERRMEEAIRERVVEKLTALCKRQEEAVQTSESPS